MLWIFLPLFLLLLLIAYLLFAPLSIEINTERNWYCLRYHRLASLFLEITDDRLSLLIKVLFWKRRISLEQEVIRDGSAGKVRKVKTNKTGKRQVSWRKIVNVIRSFRIQQCELAIDTGDMQANGLLFPLFYWAHRYTGKNIRISFTGETKIVLHVHNNLARMIRAYLKS